MTGSDPPAAWLLIWPACGPDQAYTWSVLPWPSWPGGVAHARWPSPISKPGRAGRSRSAVRPDRRGPSAVDRDEGEVTERRVGPVGDPDREVGPGLIPAGLPVDAGRGADIRRQVDRLGVRSGGRRGWRSVARLRSGASGRRRARRLGRQHLRASTTARRPGGRSPSSNRRSRDPAGPCRSSRRRRTRSGRRPVARRGPRAASGRGSPDQRGTRSPRAPSTGRTTAKPRERRPGCRRSVLPPSRRRSTGGRWWRGRRGPPRCARRRCRTRRCPGSRGR